MSTDIYDNDMIFIITTARITKIQLLEIYT